MALFTTLKRKLQKRRRTNVAGFRDYRSGKTNPLKRRPVSPKVQKAIKAKSKPASPKLKRWWLIFKIFSGLALMGVGLYFLFFSKLFTIQSVEVSSDSDFILEEKNAVTTYLQDHLGKNLLRFQSSEHEALLLEQYPNLKSIQMDRDFFHTLNVTLESYADTANIQVDHEDGTKQFFVVNELGIISGVGLTNEYLPTVVMDVTGTDLDVMGEDSPLALGEFLLDQEVLSTLLAVEKDFEGKFNMQVMEVHYLRRAREIHLYTERYFFVWIDLSQEIEPQLNKLKKAMTELNIYEAPLVYIDLRISGQNGEKVIYKLSTEEI